MKHLTSIALLISLFAGMITSASAHDAVITRSVPANGDILAESPSEVVAWFAEELISGESTMTVFSAQGAQVDNGDGGVDLDDPDHASMRITLPPLSDGSYTVQWHAKLLDGDESDGAFAFAVGEGQPIVPTAVPAPAAAESSNGPSVRLMAVVVAGLLVLLLIGLLVMRRRQS